MLRSYWDQGVALVAAVLAGTLLLMMAASVYDERSKQGDAYDYEDRAKERIAVECMEVLGSLLAQCANEIANAEAENYRSYQDLKAQEQTAKWAFFMAVFAAASTVITAVGIVLVRQTLHQTVEANRAAQDAVEVTRQIGRLQTQAYVSFHKTVTHYAFPPTGDIFLAIKVLFKNTGNSPGKIIYGLCELQLVPNASTTVSTMAGRHPSQKINLEISPGEDRWLVSPTIKVSDLMAAFGRGEALIVIGCAEYTDIFDDVTRRANFCVQIVFGGDPSLATPKQQPDHDWLAVPSYSILLI